MALSVVTPMIVAITVVMIMAVIMVMIVVALDRRNFTLGFSAMIIPVESKFIRIVTHGLDVPAKAGEFIRGGRRHLTSARIKSKPGGNFGAYRTALTRGIDGYFASKTGNVATRRNQVFRPPNGRRTVWRHNGEGGRFGQLALRTDEAAGFQIQTRLGNDICFNHLFIQPGQFQR